MAMKLVGPLTAIVLLICCSYAIAVSPLQLRLVPDSVEFLSAMAFSGRLELVNGGLDTTTVRAHFDLYFENLAFFVTRPDGYMVELSYRTQGIAVNRGPPGESLLAPGDTLRVPFCLMGGADGPLFGQPGSHGVRAWLRYDLGMPPVYADVVVTVTGPGRGHAVWLSALPSRYFSSMGGPDPDRFAIVRAAICDEPSDYCSNLETLYAYCQNGGVVPLFLSWATGARRHCFGGGTPEQTARLKAELENAIATGWERARSAGVNEEFWRQCAALYAREFGPSRRFETPQAPHSRWLLN